MLWFAAIPWWYSARWEWPQSYGMWVCWSFFQSVRGLWMHHICGRASCSDLCLWRVNLLRQENWSHTLGKGPACCGNARLEFSWTRRLTYAGICYKITVHCTCRLFINFFLIYVLRGWLCSASRVFQVLTVSLPLRWKEKQMCITAQISTLL